MLLSVAEEPESLIVPTDTGDRIHYLDWGVPEAQDAGIPPLLFIHGLGATAWSWAPVARRLRRLTNVLAMDLRGHGLSESPRSGYDLESQAFDALTVLAANGYGAEIGGRPAVVAGHGFGAMVAASMAGVQPASVAGVALVDAGWEDIGEATRQTPAEFQASVGDPPEVLASMEAYLADRREFDPPTWDADQERAARAAVDEKHAGHVAPVVRPHALRATVDAMFEYRPLPLLSGITVPVLFAVAESGSADDEVARERRVALDEVIRSRVAAGVDRQRVVRFVGAGHNLMRYRPDELAAALRDLLVAAAKL
jgi:pimeloyl-ACP methyl ester carboxylesterase